MRALSWPVVARNTLTLTPGSVLANPFTTAVTVFWVTEVYRVSCCGAWSAAVDAVVDVADGAAGGQAGQQDRQRGRDGPGKPHDDLRAGGAASGRSGPRIQPRRGGAPWPAVLFVRGPVVTGPFVTVRFVTGPFGLS